MLDPCYPIPSPCVTVTSGDIGFTQIFTRLTIQCKSNVESRGESQKPNQTIQDYHKPPANKTKNMKTKRNISKPKSKPNQIKTKPNPNKIKNKAKTMTKTKQKTKPTQNNRTKPKFKTSSQQTITRAQNIAQWKFSVYLD